MEGLLYILSEYLVYIIIMLIIVFLLPFFILYPGIYYGRFKTKGPTFPIETFDGAKIEGLVLEPHNPEKCKTTLIYLYGNSGNMGNNSQQLKELSDHLNAYVLSIDYRGFGGSYGFPSEGGIINDIYTLLCMVYDSPKFKETKLVLLGRSTGANGIIGVLDKLKNSENDSDKILYEKVSGIILEDAFTTTKDYVNKKFGKYTKYLPDFLLDIILYPNSWNNIERIKNIEKDTLFMSKKGSKDLFMEELYESNKINKYKRYYEELDYYEYIRKFVESI